MISTHILDTSVGNPAANVRVILEKRESSNWQEVGKGETNQDGRFTFDVDAIAGEYRITFAIENYYQQQKSECFFLDSQVAFRITDTDRKYHVPLLLNPYGYSTYRGS